MNLLVLTLLAFSQALAKSNYERLNSISNLHRIAFASCNKQNKRQPLWSNIILKRPDLFIWGGDNVYANTNDPEKIAASYKDQNAVRQYQLLKMTTPFIGTWDDHDYGNNNADGYYIAKSKSQEYFLNFMEEPLTSPRRTKAGIYTSYEFNSEGKTVKVILLDNRYFKNLELEAPLLGNAQWEWLENELKDSKASLHFIVSGTSVNSPPTIGEEWMDYPNEHGRLMRLIATHTPKGIIFLTGDKHFSSIFQRNGHLEFLSSGLTHNTKIHMRSYIRGRFPAPLFELNFGLIDIAWENDSPVLTLSSNLESGHVAHHRRYGWNEGTWVELQVDHP